MARLIGRVSFVTLQQLDKARELIGKAYALAASN
jgi:hypothetical protein